jgi:hypothetical protein
MEMLDNKINGLLIIKDHSLSQLTIEKSCPWLGKKWTLIITWWAKQSWNPSLSNVLCHLKDNKNGSRFLVNWKQDPPVLSFWNPKVLNYSF